MATYNNGSALSAADIAKAREWSKGKSGSEVAAQAQNLGLTADQFGSVFSGTGQNASDTGYGSGAGLNQQFNNYKFNGDQWQAPTSGGNLGMGQTNAGTMYGALGGSDPSSANARLLSGQVNNPYLDQQARNITEMMTRNMQENVLPGIGQGAQMAGQYGGSRQGIAQGKAIGDMSQNLGSALTNMYSGANENAQNRMSAAAATQSGIGAQVGMNNANLQNQWGIAEMNNATQLQGINNQYNLGQGQLALGNRTADNNFKLGTDQNTNQRYGMDKNYEVGMGNVGVGMANANNSANAATNNYNLGMSQLDSTNQRFGQTFGLDVLNSMYNWSTGGVNNANNIQNTPVNYFNNFSGNTNAIGNGYGSTTGTTNNKGNPYLGALGGFQIASKLIS